MMLWVIYILRKILHLYMIVLFLTAALSWIDLLPINYDWKQKLYKIHRFLHKFVDPITDRIDKVIGPIQLGGIRISVSFIILFFAVMFLDTFLIYLIGLYVSWFYNIPF